VTDFPGKLEILIDPLLSRVLPPHQAIELVTLEESIQVWGCQDPIILWKLTLDADVPTAVLVDGHVRFKICERLGVPMPFLWMEFESRMDVVAYLVGKHAGRRSISLDSWAYLLEVHPSLEEMARRAQRVTAGTPPKQRGTPHVVKSVPLSVPAERGAEEIAAKLLAHKLIIPYDVVQSVVDIPTSKILDHMQGIDRRLVTTRAAVVPDAVLPKEAIGREISDMDAAGRRLAKREAGGSGTWWQQKRALGDVVKVFDAERAEK
jgi:hypothetical protein